MTIVNLLFAVLTVFTALYLLGPALKAIATVPTEMRGIAKRSFGVSFNAISDDGALKQNEIIVLAGGSVFLTLLLAVFVITAYVLLVPPLAPLAGFSIEGLDSVGSGPITYAAIAAAVFVPVVGGIWCSDLARWTSLTLLAKVRHGRVAAFFFSAFAVLWALAFALVAGIYKGVLGMSDVIGAANAEASAAPLGAFLVASADCLALIGAALSAVGLEGFFKLVVALVATLIAAVMWIAAVVADTFVMLATPILDFIHRALVAAKKGFFLVRDLVNTPRQVAPLDDARDTISPETKQLIKKIENAPGAHPNVSSDVPAGKSTHLQP
jgi:hypothetical protein